MKPTLFTPVLSSRAAIGALIGLAVLANMFVAYFVTEERYVYYWDFSLFWIQYLDISTVLVQHPILALRQVIGSVWHSDYNLLPVLPLVPFEWLFGASRLTYILAITNVFALPASFLIALLAQRMSSAKRSISSFVLATAIILTLHPLWVPVLQGRPDVVGFVVIGGILLLHFGKPLAEQRWNYLLTTGLLLCLLMLLRRWYAYWVMAFFPALAVAQGLDIYQRHGLWQQYVVTARNAVIIGLTFLVGLFGFALPFALRSLTTDYSEIYSAFRTGNSLFEAALSLSFYFGWPVFFGGLIGLFWLAARRETRAMAIFLLVQSFVAFVLFARTQDFNDHHYYLVFPAIAIGLGAVVIDIATWIRNGFWRAAALGTLFTVLLAGSSAVFIPKAAPISDVLGNLAPRFQWYPLVRNDFDVLDSLLDRLGELESRQQGDIYVVASSVDLNDTILQNYCRLGSRSLSFCDRILASNNLDKRDGFPRQFLHASYLVVASPTQYVLRPDDQRVIGILEREVEAGRGIGGSFERLSGEFKFAPPLSLIPPAGRYLPEYRKHRDAGFTVWVYAKVRPFEKTDLDALAAEFAKHYPDRGFMFRTTGSCARERGPAYEYVGKLIAWIGNFQLPFDLAGRLRRYAERRQQLGDSCK
jgi:hypothetical protein